MPDEKSTTGSADPGTSVGVNEMMESAGIRNRRTLNRWVQWGAIPPPRIEQHPSGRGRRSVWDPWVLDLARDVRILTCQGQRLEDIGRGFDGNWDRYLQAWMCPWDSEEQRSQERYFVVVGAALDRGLSRNPDRVSVDPEAVERFMWAFNLQLTAATATTRMPIDLAQFPAKLGERAIELYLDGCNPVLLLAPPRPHVVADFQVSTLISEAMVKTPYLVIPLNELVAGVLGDKSQKRNRTVRPARKVLIKEPDGEREVAFTPQASLTFALRMPDTDQPEEGEREVPIETDECEDQPVDERS